MAGNGIKETVAVYAFGILLFFGTGTFIASSAVTIHMFNLFRREFITTLSKRFRGNVNEEATAADDNNNYRRRRLKFSEIISQIYWYHTIGETFHFFTWALVPEEFYPNLEAYLRPYKKKVTKYNNNNRNRRRRTPLIFKYLMNNPSETAADFAETFTRRVLANLGFHHYYSSSWYSDHNNYEYPGYTDYRVSFFEEAVSKSCFARQLVEIYNSIDWDSNAGVPPPAPTRLTEFEKRVLRRFYFEPDDDEWIEPLNNWFNWYIKTIHERIFPSLDFQVFEATVKFLLFSFFHDTATPFISLFALVGVTTS